MKSRSKQMLDKSISAMLAAIEIYNKPHFEYREETFSILLINSWELLFKARILQLEQNKIGSILEYEKRQLQDGSDSQKLYRKKNRSGNYVSIGLFKAVDRLLNEYDDTIPLPVRNNIEALTEIRDNSIHFMNQDFVLRKRVYELSSANTINFLNLVRQWFGRDLSEFNLFLMPIAFVRNCNSADGQVLNSQEQKVIKYIKDLETNTEKDHVDDYAFSLDIELRMKRTSSKKSSNEVNVTNNPDAASIRLDEEDIREKFPWSYAILTKRLSDKFTDFLMNQRFYAIKRELEKNPSLCNSRFLDPGNPKSAKKKFYNPNIIKEFDKHYTKKASTR